jgi:hypothetical protein
MDRRVERYGAERDSRGLKTEAHLAALRWRGVVTHLVV